MLPLDLQKSILSLVRDPNVLFICRHVCKHWYSYIPFVRYNFFVEISKHNNIRLFSWAQNYGYKIDHYDFIEYVIKPGHIALFQIVDAHFTEDKKSYPQITAHILRYEHLDMYHVAMELGWPCTEYSHKLAKYLTIHDRIVESRNLMEIDIVATELLELYGCLRIGKFKGLLDNRQFVGDLVYEIEKSLENQVEGLYYDTFINDRLNYYLEFFSNLLKD